MNIKYFRQFFFFMGTFFFWNAYKSLIKIGAKEILFVLGGASAPLNSPVRVRRSPHRENWIPLANWLSGIIDLCFWIWFAKILSRRNWKFCWAKKIGKLFLHPFQNIAHRLEQKKLSKTVGVSRIMVIYGNILVNFLRILSTKSTISHKIANIGKLFIFTDLRILRII